MRVRYSLLHAWICVDHVRLGFLTSLLTSLCSLALTPAKNVLIESTIYRVLSDLRECLLLGFGDLIAIIPL